MADSQTTNPGGTGISGGQPVTAAAHAQPSGADPTRCFACDNDIETGGCRCNATNPCHGLPSNELHPAATPLDDPRWTTPVGVPHTAFSKVADLAGSGTPIQQMVNVAIYRQAGRRSPCIKPADALSAFEAALTLVLANGQIAAEAMFQAGFPRAEIDDRITRFTSALHQASTNPSAFFAASGRRVLSAAAGTNPAAAFSVTQPGAVTTPAPAISSSAAGEGAPPSAVSPSACAPTASSGGEA